MTLQELKKTIEELERNYGPDVLELDVLAEYDYGNHCHTRALTRIRAAEVVTPRETAYSDSGLACPDDERIGGDSVVSGQIVALTT